MTAQPYEVALKRAARRALAEELPLDVAVGVSEFITGQLASQPYRVGKPLDPPLQDKRSARVMREWRLLYMVDDQRHRVTVESVRHRRDAYRTP